MTLIVNSQHRPEVVEASLDACLAELELEYLDVRLIPGLEIITRHTKKMKKILLTIL